MRHKDYTPIAWITIVAIILFFIGKALGMW